MKKAVLVIGIIAIVIAVVFQFFLENTPLNNVMVPAGRTGWDFQPVEEPLNEHISWICWTIGVTCIYLYFKLPKH